jgi:uncharacterized protein
MTEKTKNYTATSAIDVGLRDYMLKVYNYMCAGLAISTVSAFLTIHFPPLRNLIFSINNYHISLTLIGMIVGFAPLVIGIYFFSKQGSLSIERGKNLFWVYSAINGMSLASLGIVYTHQSIALTFLVCACLFAGMSIYGHTTKRDLTELGSFLIMGVFGLIIASVINLFVRSSALNFITSAIGVLAFTGLVAYDTQKIKACYYDSLERGGEVTSKAALVGAFTLYLDVINLFIHLLRFLGVRRRGSE